MIISREKERSQFLELYGSGKPELIAVCGRLRVGKTFLIRETFNGDFFFCFTGDTACKTLPAQLGGFEHALREQVAARQSPSGKQTKPFKKIKTWNEAFDRLAEFIASEGYSEGSRKVIFIDEMPWLDTPKSGFLAAFEYFWNSFGSSRRDVMFIMCASSASWIAKKILQDRGGLHNRITGRIWLKPFTLGESEAFLEAKGSGYKRHELIECYMVFGGIPYYLDRIDGKCSLAVNIDRLLFEENAPLSNEFDWLIASLFGGSGLHLKVLEALSGNMGLTREEIIHVSQCTNGSGLSQALNELELNGFVRKYLAFPKKENGAIYRLIDNFSMFCLQFLQKERPAGPHFWSAIGNSPENNLDNWRDCAFATACLLHLEQLKRALGISGVLTSISAWKSRSASPVAQTSLVIERADRIANLIETKFSTSEFEVEESHEEDLRNKLSLFQSETKTRLTLKFVAVTTYGVKRGKYSGIFSADLDMDSLFLP